MINHPLIDSNLSDEHQHESLSIVVPVYNEEAVIPEFNQRLHRVLDSLAMVIEIVYINDGSTDGTLALLETLRSEYPQTAIIDLSRNFGKEIAMTAGLDYAHSDAVIVIDVDLQDPPELIPELIEQWRAGYDVVYAQRTVREGESAPRKLAAHLFYRLMSRMSRVDIPEDTGDFRLLSRRTIEALRQIREQHRYMKGIFAWIGYPQKAVLYQRHPRFAGSTKWSFHGLWNLALEGLTSFTTAPLKLATYLGLVVAMLSFVYGMAMIAKTLLYGNPVPGYPSLMVVILFIGGVQLIATGIIGEYLGRTFDESKRRPLYLIKHTHPAATPSINRHNKDDVTSA